MGCERHENYAPSLHYSFPSEYDGAVVDNENLNITSRNFTALPDLGDQIWQWIPSYLEMQKWTTAEELQAINNRTIFVIYFGVWDIWHASGMEMNDGLGVIERGIDLMFHRISVLTEYWGNYTLRIVIPLAVDPTFLPGWQTRLHPGEHESGVRVQRSAVSLVHRWNENLEASARKIEKVQIYLFDTNAFITDRIRDQQMYSSGVSDADGWGKRGPTWEIVDAACGGGHDRESSRTANGGKSPCKYPEKYLYW
jgi:hypothetical protein